MHLWKEVWMSIQMMTNNSISVSLKQQFSTNNEKSAYETVNEPKEEHDAKPVSSYFKTRYAKDSKNRSK